MFWTGISSLIGLAFFGFIFKESFWPLTDYDLVSIVGQGFFIHVIGQGCLAYAMGRIPPSYSALIMLLAPVTAAFAGWVIYSESLTPLKIIGIIIIMSSILAVRRKR